VYGPAQTPDAAGYGPLKTLIPVPNRDGSPMKMPVRHSLATDKVRFVGDPVAFVVAETLAQARTRPKRSCSTSTPCRR
jgi:carbon-monoxide dehydrogenase large subunit